MKCVPPTTSPVDLDQMTSTYAFTPELDELAAGLSIWANPTRIRIFALLRDAEQMCVCDLAKVLGVSVSAVSQNLAKMRAHKFVQYRREAQTLYYSLSDHPLNANIRDIVQRVSDQPA